MRGYPLLNITHHNHNPKVTITEKESTPSSLISINWGVFLGSTWHFNENNRVEFEEINLEEGYLQIVKFFFV